LDQSPPNPTALLSAEEAKERLREIVERFFFRQRRGDQEQPPPRQLLVRSPPGLGKTKEAMEWATRYQTEQDTILQEWSGE
jgi:SpoVK/Ycf46/Vps4 family AAA+-type ATPase